MALPTRWTWTTGARRWRAAAWIALVLVLGGCGRKAPEPVVPGFARELALGAQYADRLAARQRNAAAMSDEEVIAAGYLERLRVGMGSPFRLMEYALHDPRLTKGTRAPLVWAMIEATRAGRGYRIDPRALVRIGRDAGARNADTAAAHLALIERVVREAGDPRAGELAVREAYRLAAVSHSVSPTAPIHASSAAALARDREAARRDAVRLLAHAARVGRHPFAVLVEWRSGRRLEVQLPAGAPRAPAVEDAAAERAVALVAEVEAVGTRPAPRARPDSLAPLTPPAARRLAALARAHSYPTQAPVWITVRRYDDQLLRGLAGDARARRAVKRLLDRARTEETLVAEAAVVGGVAPRAREVLALVTMETSVAMRAYAQERVWFPGFAAPTATDLKRSYGLGGVEFDGEVPIAWRPYYRRMLGDALADLEVVLPSLDLQGATFRIGATRLGGGALATHTPSDRIIHLPPESGAGAIAHEVGHDLDWQAAHALYGTSASYGTEHAVRTGRDDRFAEAVRRMPVPSEVPTRGAPELQRRYAQRPAEIFARTFEGYVAAALAERGRSNGYLTAAQDEFLGGHGLALMPGSRPGAAEPFMEMMTVASPVPEPARRGFLGRWGAGRVPGGFDVAHRITSGDARSAPAPERRPAPGMTELLAAGGEVRAEVAAVAALRDSALAEWSAARCANPLAARGSRGEPAVRALADAAVSARARAIVLGRARSLGLDRAPAWLAVAWLGSPPTRPPLFTRGAACPPTR
jgi:hypothetical protein